MPHPSSPTQLRDGYRAATTTLRRQVQTFVAASWGNLDSWRQPDIDRFVAQVAPVVAGGQRQTASLTDAYFAHLAVVATGAAVRPIGIPTKTITDTVMRGVDVRDVYARTGPTVWTALSRGNTLEDAVRQGLTRAVVTAGTDLQLAKTHAARYTLERSDNVVGYQRVPEGDACELCLLASTQRYHSEDLMPIHDRCSCDVEAIYGTEDPGHVIDSELLDRLNAGSVDEARQFYADRVAVQEHGELGPVLTAAGQTFTGPDDVE